MKEEAKSQQPSIKFSLEDRRKASIDRDWKFLSVFDLTAMQNIRAELYRARDLHPNFPTIHHAMAVIREEYKELEEAAFHRDVETEPGRYDELKKEAIQLAATCIRLIVEL